MKTLFSKLQQMTNAYKVSPAHFVFRIFPVIFTLLFFSVHALADGTRQASPTNSVDGASLLIAPDLNYGSYMGAANDNRIRFTILNAATENLYFGFQTRNYSTTGSTTLNTAYYRIYNAAGTQVVGPTLIPTAGAGFIANYAQAFAGPNIGGATPAGYNPMMFDPATTGDFYIEIYRSDDGGVTMDASTNGRITMPFFDFTVSTTANTQSIGRVWSRKWSFVTTNLTSGNFEQSIASSFTGDYYAYTPDQFIVQVQFQNGFRPLAYEVAMNFNGAANTGNFVNDRRSSSAIAALTNGYQVFLTTPDAAAFPNGITGNPAFTSNIYGCPGAYLIPYYIDQAGDVGIVLDLNGTAGYQAGTADIELTAFGMAAGNHVMLWNGLNGLGAAVPANFSASVQITLYQGRTNIPMNDAEMNINGLTIISVFPSSGSKRLYWDDTNITPVGACTGTGDNNNNVTTGGVQGIVLANGVLGPTHAWNGSNPTTAVPAPASGGGNGTALLCDDYGNARCINTWFYAVDLSSPVTTMILPSCDKDNDGIADNTDLDDDNDGVADLVENAGLDATADADSDGIPNYLDTDASGFVDTNFDGVDDRYDFDRDGVINSFDLDSDNDGIPDLIENGQPDANSNAQIDGFVDLNANGLSDVVDPACNNTLVFALAGAGTTGTVTNAAGAFDNSLTTLATLGATGAIDIDLGAVIPSGTVITVNLSSAITGIAATGSVFYSTDDVTYTLINTYSNNANSANGTAITYTLPAAARYIRVTRATNSPRLHAIRYPICAGVTGTAITPINTDGTGGANYLDIDSDNDGITDNSEAQSTSGYIAPTGSDTDRDGIENAYDAVAGFGGTGLIPVNTDGTDNPDYTDLDSDNDNITDAIEGWDTDGDGNANTVPAGADSDNDGLDNAYDVNDSAINPTNGTTPSSYPNVIISGTPERDWREVNPPKVTLTGTTSVLENSGTAVTLTATLSAPTGANTVVTLTYSGTATNGVDYTASSVTITILAGATTGTVTVTPINDGNYEGNETVIATITSVTGGNGATIGTPASATVTITDDETVPTVSISGGTTITENSGGSVTLTVTLSAPTTVATVVNLGYTGTAISGTDYTAGAASVTIPANSTTATLNITPINDGTYEGNETVITTITSVTGGNGATIGTPASTTTTIADDEAVPTVSISGGTTIAENSPGTVTLTVTLSAPTTVATVVNLGYTGTATAGTDYVAGVASVTIPANATTATLVIDPNDDALYEGNETVITTITSVTGGNGATIGTPASTTTTITDNETVPTVSISGGTTIAENSPGTVTLTVTLSAPTTVATVVNLGYTGTAAAGTDYVAGVTSVTIPANATTATLVIDPNDDALYEGNETVITTITSVTGGNGATIGTPASTTTTITDNETVPTVSISGGVTIAENSPGTVTLTVTLSGPTSVATVVNLGYTGTATAGTDYVAGVTSVTIPANATTATLVIDPNDDALYEGNETVITTITSVTGGNGATIGTPASTTTTIVDNETVPTVSISGGTTIGENSGGSVTLTVTLSSPTTVATVVNLAYTGTATSAADYTAGVASVTIPANSTTVTVTLTPINDGTYEGNETVITTITSVTGGNGATIGTPAATTTTIVDDETIPTVSISGGTTIAENSPGTVTLTVTLSTPTTVATVVNIGYTGTATSGTDYVTGTASVTIPANATTATLVIDPTDDLIYEGDETVITTITSVTGGNGATIGSPASTTVTIIDNDNSAPIANDNSATTNEDAAVVLPAIQTNDTDADGTVVTSTIDLNPALPGQQTTFANANGSWTVNTTTGNVTFTPALNFNGTATITYTINDNNGATSNTANLTVVVAPVNDAPIVDNETHTINEDTPATGDLTNAGDSDPDGTPLTANTTPVSGPSNGNIVINANGTYTYTPNANFNGTDMVVVSICDAGLPLPASCVNDTIFITVTPVNDAPIVDNETQTINEDTPATGDLTNAGDSDPDGTTLTANTTPVSGPSNGNIVINADGTYTYTPNANFNGTDMVVVSICDAGLPLPATCVNDTIFITVTSVNDAPIVDNETHTINEDTPATGDLTNAGDSDPDGTTLTANTTPVSGPSNGNIVINADGTYTYTPNANFNGTDMVVVSICDAGLPLPASCVNDTIFITVTPVNDAPIVDNETQTINEDTPATGDLTNAGDSDPDGTALTANTTPVSGPSNGNIVINADGTYTYTPNANFNGTDMVIVSICDAGLPLPASCVNDTIFITVTSVNDAPIVDNETQTINEDAPATGDLTNAGDSDPDGTALTANTTPVSGPSNGTILINANGTYTYTPNANFNGTDMVIVSICDAGLPLPGICVNDTIFITVTPVNDAPIVDNETQTINEDTPAIGDLTNAGDSDPDGTTLTANTTPVSGPSNGNIVINANGTYTYTPNANFNGTDMVIVSICDAGLPLPGICVNDTIFITVTTVNDAPIVDNEMHTINEDTPATGDLTNAGDSDPDGTALTANTTPVSGPSNGTILINTDGTYTYTPNANFNGTDMVVVSICDAGLPLPGICVNDTIFITVTPVNDAPIVDNETQTINEDAPAIGDLTNAGDSDPDGTTLTANTTPVSGPSNGTIVINPDGTYTYTPNANFSGTDTIVVSICDAGLPLPAICVNDTIFITITPVNDAPVIDNETVITTVGNSASGDLTNGGDFDADGNLVVNTTPVSGPNNGTITINPDGTFTYAPNNGFSGNDTIIVSICDDGNPLPANCVNDTIFVTVIACPSSVDSDGDGLTDCEEVTGTDDPSTPTVPVGTSNPNDPCDPNPLVDTDGDGLTNCEETTGVDNPSTPAVPNGTSDPNNACSPIGLVTVDTDGDGLTDCEETTGVNDPSTPPTPNGTSDPNSACSPIGLITTDTDGDGLTDCEETTGVNDPSTPATPNGTSDPNSACSPIGLVITDSDGDGLTDCEETTGTDDPSTPGVPNGTSNPNDPCSPKPCGIDIPQAFTPDGDGTNDEFVIGGIEQFPNNTISIFNRWGNIVFETEKYDNTWRGNSNSQLNIGGDELPTGTYFYIFDTGTEEYGVLKGYIYLKR